MWVEKVAVAWFHSCDFGGYCVAECRLASNPGSLQLMLLNPTDLGLDTSQSHKSVSMRLQKIVICSMEIFLKIEPNGSWYKERRAEHRRESMVCECCLDDCRNPRTELQAWAEVGLDDFSSGSLASV